ncbi:MAG: hypothetical protein IJC57_03255 [Clostridia bacterium]|nr:hypothetical protein [Clostridia bacterium]
MKNKQYYSCERNNYFFGKLMTVRDFQTEQSYMNSKRRLGNKMLNGTGIVSGLDVILVDNKTFSLETGMALDYMGREIVVAEPYVRRLNVIKGFEENKNNGILYLCLAYKEDLKETTFSVSGSGKSTGVSEEYNRIHENYELFLTSEKPKPELLKLDSLLYDTLELYNQDGVKINLEINKYVNPSQLLKISVIFEKENIEAPVSYNFDMQGEFFKTCLGEKKLNINYQETEISTYKNFRKDYYLKCDAVSDALAKLIINKQSFVLKIGNEEIKLKDDFECPVSIKTTPIKDIIIQDYYAKNFNELIEKVENKYIYLAKFHIVTNQLNYFIESFEKHPFKQYLYSNELITLLQSIDQNNTNNLNPKKSGNNNIQEDNTDESAPEVLDLEQPKIDNIITGVERINLGFNPKVGKSYYSYEFVHGLGEGNIGVITAIDNKANYMKDDKGLLVFGDKSIFSKDEISISAPNVQIAAIVNSQKGTVKLGVKLLEKTIAQAVDIRWWAYKPVEIHEEQEDIIIDENIRVVITPNTVRIKPLEQTRFEAHIDGAISQEIRWAMAEENTGTIDNNGLYTAPAKEGVYEIKAYSVKFENKSDSAYVVVSSTE